VEDARRRAADLVLLARELAAAPQGVAEAEQELQDRARARGSLLESASAAAGTGPPPGTT
jgi:hypothetical protein